MKRRFGAGVLVAMLLVTLIVLPVVAAPPMDVHIEVVATLDPDPDPFVASGPAVDAGLLCETGQSVNLSVVVTGPPAGDFSILKVLKQFTCDDGSGTFDVSMVVKLDLITHETTANWNIAGGSGDYAGLHGNGKLVGIPIEPGVSILDIYDGKLH